MRRHLTIAAAGLVLAGACTSGDDGGSAAGTDGTVATEATAPPATFPANPRPTASRRTPSRSV